MLQNNYLTHPKLISYISHRTTLYISVALPGYFYILEVFFPEMTFSVFKCQAIRAAKLPYATHVYNPAVQN